MLTALWLGAVGCDPAQGGWTCPVVVTAPQHHAGTASQAGARAPAGTGAGSGAPAGAQAPDPNAICLTASVCDQVGIGAGTQAGNDDPPPKVSTIDLARMASDALVIRPPAPRTEPSVRTWVAFPTYLLIDPAAWHPTSATASLDGQSVTATGEPARVVWDLGETTVTCEGPGDEHGSCAYAFRRPAGTRPVTATVYYRVGWRCSGACDAPSGSLGELPTTGRTSLRVSEIQTSDGG